MENLNEVFEFMGPYIWHGLTVLFRVGAIVTLLPGFGAETIPARVKLIIAFCFTAIVAPAVEPAATLTNPFDLASVVFSETLIGFLFGIGVRFFLMSLQTAGTIAAQSTSLSQLLGGAVTEPLAAIGYILTMGAIALAMITGFHIKIAAAMISSYKIIPIGFEISGNWVTDWGIKQVTFAFQFAFILSSPFMLVSVLYNLALGVINKAMPQLMVAFVGAPIITFGGLFLIFATSPYLLSAWLGKLENFLHNPWGSF
ncbi:MAG: flagellar biosynthetic protein FliR [Lentilitoribacter sp.]